MTTPTTAGGFGPLQLPREESASIPKWVLEAPPNLSNASDIKVLMFLAARAQRVPVGPGELGDLTGLGFRTVAASLERLGRLGYAVGHQRTWCLLGAAEPLTRAHIPLEVRQSVLQRDGYACRYCGNADNLSLDHIQPWSRGGPDSMDNLVACCRFGSSRKNAKTPEEAGMPLRPLRQGMN